LQGVAVVVNGQAAVVVALGDFAQQLILRFLLVQQLLLLLAVVVQEVVIKAPCLPLVLIQFFLLSHQLVAATADTTALVEVPVVLAVVALRVRQVAREFLDKVLRVEQVEIVIQVAVVAARLKLEGMHQEIRRGMEATALLLLTVVQR
jgi:hypothetical protein